MKDYRNEGARSSLSFGGRAWGEEEPTPNGHRRPRQQRSDNVLSPGTEVERRAGDRARVANGLIMKEDEAGKPGHRAQT